MLEGKRFDYIFMSSEETAWFLSNKFTFKNSLKSLNIDNASEGNERYLLFSKGVSDEVIQKINSAIITIKETDKYKEIENQNKNF